MWHSETHFYHNADSFGGRHLLLGRIRSTEETNDARKRGQKKDGIERFWKLCEKCGKEAYLAENDSDARGNLEVNLPEKVRALLKQVLRAARSWRL
jgi:hypothetical protein